MSIAESFILNQNVQVRRNPEDLFERDFCGRIVGFVGDSFRVRDPDEDEWILAADQLEDYEEN